MARPAAIGALALRRSGALAVLAFGAVLASCAAPDADAPRAHVYIPRGSPLAAVADSLVAHGVIETAWTFRLYARTRGLARRVRPGLYAFPLGERWSTIVTALKTGRTDDFLFTVPEGYTVRQIADLAADRLRLARDSVREAVRDSFLAAARDPLVRERFGIGAPALREPLEGYLLPETYRVAFDATPRDLVLQMIRQYLSVWGAEEDKAAADLGLSRHQVMVLASIVEAEALLPQEMPRIAGVYLNRIRRRMLLQADPTVIYAIELTNDRKIRRVLYSHLRYRSPYNTYMYPGLPPGPIGNPGKAAIQASLHPERHDFLFFVARPEGRHMFSRTGFEHADSVAVARLLRAQFQARRDSILRDSIRAAREATRSAAVPVAPSRATP